MSACLYQVQGMRVSEAAEVLRVMKEQLREQLTRPKYELLIRPLRALSYATAEEGEEPGGADGGPGGAHAGAARLTLSISNEVLRGWLLENYGALLSELAGLVVGEPVEVSVEVGAAEAGAAVEGAPVPGAGLGEAALAAPRLKAARKPLLNPRYTFDNFVAGRANQFCLSACHLVAQRPGQSYKPLFIYGGVGLGKTHLLHAIGHSLWQREHAAGVVYVTSEKFTNDFVECVRTGRMGEFHARYREADLLLLDDVQFLSGKPETQLEFFHTFMACIEAGRQVVLSADRPPRTLKGLEERLLSRFSMGLVCDIGEPGLETRVAIIRAKAELERIALPAEVCQYIAERVSANVRELEGALIRLMAFCEFAGSAPSLELASRVLSDFVSPGGLRPQLTMRQILGVVGEYFNLSESVLLSPNRSKRVALARMLAMYLAREYTNLTLSQIGAELGGRDHSTISHGANKIAAEMLEDPFVEQAVAQLSRMLR